MKTVIDAVNYYGGNNLSGQVDAIHFNGGFFPGANDADMNDFVCSLAKYTRCVDEMATNYGTSETYADYKINYGSIQLKDDIKPVTAPVYTQAIHDKGIMPLVGQSCMIYYNEADSRYNDFFDVEIKILAVTNGVFTFSNPLLGYAALSLDIKCIVPIPPPKTDTEKAIDDLRKMDESISNDIEWHKNFIAAIKVGKIHGVAFTGEL